MNRESDPWDEAVEITQGCFWTIIIVAAVLLLGFLIGLMRG